VRGRWDKSEDSREAWGSLLDQLCCPRRPWWKEELLSVKWVNFLRLTTQEVSTARKSFLTLRENRLFSLLSLFFKA
jgi:hypothetical protein